MSALYATLLSPTKKGNAMNERNEAFDEMLDDVYQPFTIGYLTFYASDILFECDPIAYRVSLSDWEDSLED